MTDAKRLKPNCPRATMIFIACVLFGVVVDFIFGGVLKIVWFALYLTFYVTCASTLYTYLDKKNLQIAKASAIGFFCAALLAHFILVGWKESRHFSMNVLRYPPLTLATPLIVQSLVVESEKVEKYLAQNNITKNIDVKVDVVRDYGCIKSFRVSSVMGIDVMIDAQATWTLKDDKQNLDTSIKFQGMHEENQRLPWCHFNWYEIM